jgi:hypothetical protein
VSNKQTNAIRMTRQSPAYWRVTFDHPPLLFDRGFHQPGDVETRLGYQVGRLGLAENTAKFTDE